MSRQLRISFVVEGPTDYSVLEALALRLLGDRDFVSGRIQPPQDAVADDQGPLGGGWRGVLRWCEQQSTEYGDVSAGVAYANCDVLVIHVDADIARESELAHLSLSRPCPPARNTCDEIRNHLTGLLRSGDSASKVVLCVPAQCTEAWVFAALYPEHAERHDPLECRAEPERLLIGKTERLVRDKEGRARKDPAGYRAHAPKIAAGWDDAATRCPQAARFATEFARVAGVFAGPQSGGTKP